ncbi:protein turtle [Sitodiplosis mosellana]|uniref:protein turtle n=1 Tax=Sitodiplosis mosellana TaxID=263140 RepID=UPI002443761D|nr:protein turtle [Sitodiplosis mosellana]
MSSPLSSFSATATVNEDIMWFAARALLLLTLISDFAASVKDIPVVAMEALIGETTYLPCNVSTHDVNDDVVLVLWYRADKGTPVYSVDIRDRDFKAAKRWSDETVFANRAYFLFEKQPGELAVQNAKESDSGIYRCRVDFKVAQTRNSKVNLTVILPPDRISIKDDTGVERSSVVGPYAEGDIITLSCEVFGGKPMPVIHWYRDSIPIHSETYETNDGKSVKSDITLGPLGRQDLNTRLTCKAINHPRASPLETTVQIDMNFSPLNIRLLGAHQPLSAGKRYDLLCQSAGSRPPAVITWWRDGQRLEKTTETLSSDGNQTTSTLSITLSRADSGRYLSCRAYNPALQSETLSDGWQLDITYVPETKVKLGSSLDPSTIREGTDVYFDCLVTAHPHVYKVEWRHNGRMLPHNISQGVIISNHSLVLQGVSRATAGNYSCVGFNAEGDGISPSFTLNVLYAPSCSPSQPRIYGVAKQEQAQIRCSVDANPLDVEFKWTFNNSAESIDVASNHVTRSGTSSIVTYTPMTELDYGTLLCVASNRIGRQRVPCVYHVIAAGRPDQVHNCTITNISMTSLGIKCLEGFNGGLTQSFMLEVRDMSTQDIRANFTSPVARFAVSNLHPGSVYIISIYAFNSKGRSDPAVLPAAMLRPAEKQLTAEKERPRAPIALTPMLSVVIGLSAALVIGALAIIVVLRLPCGGRRRSRFKRKELSQGTTTGEGSPGPSDKSIGSRELDGNESDEKNPDIIPDTVDSDDQIEYIHRRQHISTIDTNSPQRGGSSNVSCAVNAIPNQQYVSASVPMHTGHAPVNYCTLRNGSTSQASANMGSTLSISPVPNAYQNQMTTCTLPRHPGQVNAHHWSSYGGTIASVRQIPQVQISGLQTAPPPPSQIAMHHLNSRTARHCIPAALVDDEVTVETPLMVKRESTV